MAVESSEDCDIIYTLISINIFLKYLHPKKLMTIEVNISEWVWIKWCGNKTSILLSAFVNFWVKQWQWDRIFECTLG